MTSVAVHRPPGATPERTPTLGLGVALVAGGVGFGALAGYLGTTGHVTRVLALAVVLLPVAIWKRPHIAPAVLLSAAILVEQNGQVPKIPLTGSIPMFQGIGPGHLQGTDILLLVIAFICVVKRHELGLDWRARSHVSAAIAAVLGCVVLALVVGHVHHGSLRTGLMEARPFVYLAVTYILTAVLIESRAAIRSMLWAFVAAVGFKAFQGLYIWVGHRHDYPKPEAYISHEASYFFVIFINLVLALWIFHQRGRLRTVATWLLPVVAMADIVNDRRVAWAMLGGATLCLGVIAYQALPSRRHTLGRSAVALTLISAVYFPVMWNSTGTVAQPVRAVKSQIHPSTRDATSDLYRVQENANLEYNIRQAGLLGKGFGVKIDYALPITDISSLDPLIAYVPHDSALDAMMRMGIFGAAAVWFLISAGIISGSRLARTADLELALIGAVTAPALVAWAVMAAEDHAFFWFRIMLITGCLLGLSEASWRLSRAGKLSPAAR